MLEPLTVGIAGHVDHGKTSLVKAITGVDTDRMKEEKRRGMSIEFGIAPVALKTGRTLSLVDVPGHTDFLKNTIRGLGCVDAAVMVVAADDGVMPQTKDHLEILKFLEVSTGFVVLSKVDCVDEDTRELAEIEIRELTCGTFLENAPVIPFSSVTGLGLDRVMAALEELSVGASPYHRTDAPFRMFVDQVRSLRGYGTVVSGTVVSGMIHAGDRVEIVPARKVVRARYLQVHHVFVDEATAGMRVGVNLQGIDERDVPRGSVLAEPGAVAPAALLNCAAVVSEGMTRPITRLERLRVFIGSCAVHARIVPMEGSCLEPGSSGLVQLRLEEDTGACALDRFVATCLGEPRVACGGRILEVTHTKYRSAHAPHTVPFLRAVWLGDAQELVSAWCECRPERAMRPHEIAKATGMDGEALAQSLARACEAGDVVDLRTGEYASTAFVERLCGMVKDIVHRELERDTTRSTVGIHHIASCLPKGLDRAILSCVLERLVKDGVLVEAQGGFTLASLKDKKCSETETLAGEVLSFVEASGACPATMAHILEALGRDRVTRPMKAAVDFLVAQGDLVRLPNDRLISRTGLEEVKRRVARAIRQKGFITPADCKDVLGYGRTAGIPLLEYLDAVGFTCRKDNVRILAESIHGAHPS